VLSHEGRVPAGETGIASPTSRSTPDPDPVGTAVLDFLSSGIALIAPDGAIVFVNRAWTALFSACAADCIGQPVWNVFPQLRSGSTGAGPLATLQDGVPRQAHVPFRQGLYEIRSTRNSVGMLVLEVRDWTRVARLERQHDRLLESITDGLCVLDDKWCFSYWNAAAEQITGVSRAELIGKPVPAAFRNLEGTPLAKALRDTLHSHGERQVHRWRYEGDERGRAAGVYDAFSYAVEGGGLLIIFREVSDRIDQERELAERGEEADALRRLARAMAEEKDFERLLRLLCEDALRQTGAEGSAVVQIHEHEGEVVATAGTSSVLRGSHFPLEGSLTAMAIGRRAMVAEASYAGRYSGHPKFAAAAHAGPVLVTPLIAHDHVLGVITVSRSAGNGDFTTRDRERLQAIADHTSLGLWKLQLLDQAQAASQAKSDFMATMSHELRTPLTALTGYGELLGEEIVGPLNTQQSDVVERMRSVTHHLGVVIDEILTFSNLEAGRELFRPAHVDLATLVRSVVAVVEPIARQKHIAFATAVPNGLTMVTDPDKARQILVNLIGNAIKFTDAGSVSLRIGELDDWIAFEVKDTGIGIRATDRARLFQPFSQLDSGLTRRFGGTGLGLFISRRLATLLGGRIELESEPGKGSTFTLLLPSQPGCPV
jgi:PAS domain S-box-containing protein